MPIQNKIFLDFDGVIVNTIKRIVDMYNYDFCYYKDYKYIHESDIKTWDFIECSLASPDYINTYFNQPRFFKHLEWMADAEDVLPLLSKDFDLYVVSHGYSPNLKGKRIWIERNMPYVREFIGVNLKLHNDKSSVDMSNAIFVDDKESNLRTSNATTKICFGRKYSWNRDWNGIWVNNFSGIVDMLYNK